MDQSECHEFMMHIFINSAIVEVPETHSRRAVKPSSRPGGQNVDMAIQAPETFMQ